MRMGEERLVNRLFKRMALGTRPKGRPKTRWKDQVHTDMKELKIQYTPDRAEWKKKTDLFCLRMGTELVPETLYSNELTRLCAREDYIE
jgi:hypothetical protein